MLVAALAVGERRRSVVAGTRIDAVEHDHLKRHRLLQSGETLAYSLPPRNHKEALMRIIMVVGLAGLLMIPGAYAAARSGSAVQAERPSDLSGARKKKRTAKKSAPKEQYLRAVPSTPPAGTKK
jgi:hypothetical protein